MTSTQHCPEKFEIQLTQARDVIRRLCFQRRLSSEEAEDFTSYALLSLIEDNYGVLRRFQGRSSLGTFLTVVVHRLFLDYRVQKWGKWRPTAEVLRLGAAATELDRLLNRDGQILPNAVEIVHARLGGSLSREQLFKLASGLPLRQRLHFEGAEQLEDIPADGGVEEILEGRERANIMKRIKSTLTQALRDLPVEDRLILKMRHEDGFTVREIAIALHLKARPLYTRFEKCHRQLREILERGGIRWDDVKAVLGWADCDLETNLLDSVDAAQRPSKRGDGLNLPIVRSKRRQPVSER